MEVTFETRRRGIINIIYIQTFLCSLLSIFMASRGTDTDIFCLKSIKDSLEDPYNYLSSSWDFNNETEGFICRFNGIECWHPDENRVLNLKLSNMGLKGQFPRAIQNCMSLTGLNLSLNELSGPIPSDVSTLIRFATSIDLSSNKLTGEIPVSLVNMIYLNYLNLDNNMLSGQIPPQLAQLPRIRSISFANNELSGPVPVFEDGQGATADSYANNSGLCGGPLAPCSSLDNHDSHGPMRYHQSFKDGLIVGFAFSFVSAIAASAYLSCCSPRTQLKRTRNNQRNKATELGKYIRYVMQILQRKMRIVTTHILGFSPLQLQGKGRKRVALLMESLTSTMRFDELNDATDCFSIDNAIGVGNMGIMYKGTLANGWHLAVKRILDSQLFGRQVILEIRILGNLRHRNIIPLLGFCLENKERIVVYQYMSNGRLSKWLHPMESEVMRLKWPQRIKIALGLARALSWLHHTCNLHIVHLNVSSDCILLDKNFEPKLSNFGEAKFMNPSNENDLGVTFNVKDGKKDVHDFGSVLFELVTGKTFTELLCSSTTASLSTNPSTIYDAIDKSLFGKRFENEVFTLIKVACECVQPFPDQRPTMLQVYNNMSNIWEGPYGFSDDSDMPRQSEIASATDSDEIVEL